MDSDRSRHDDEISLLAVASLFLRRRHWIILSAFVGGLVALVGALRTPIEYTATASFLPNGGDQAVGLGAAGLAQQFGFVVPRSGDAARSPEFYQDLISSRRILDGLIQRGVEVPTVAGTTIIDLPQYLEIERETVEEEYAAARVLVARMISVTIAVGTGVVTVSVQTDDPGLSVAMVGRLLDLIATFDVETRQSQASAERNFAEQRLGELRGEFTITEDSLKAFLVENRQFLNSPQLTFERDRLQRQVIMRQELMTAMAQAYEQARIDEVRAAPVITVIDQPEPPALADPRGRLQRLVLGIVLGMIGGFALALVREVAARAKDDQSVAYGEFRDVIKDVKGDPFGLRRAR